MGSDVKIGMIGPKALGRKIVLDLSVEQPLYLIAWLELA